MALRVSRVEAARHGGVACYAEDSADIVAFDGEGLGRWRAVEVRFLAPESDAPRVGDVVDVALLSGPALHEAGAPPNPGTTVGQPVPDVGELIGPAFSFLAAVLGVSPVTVDRALDDLTEAVIDQDTARRRPGAKPPT